MTTYILSVDDGDAGQDYVFNSLEQALKTAKAKFKSGAFSVQVSHYDINESYVNDLWMERE